MGLIIGSQPHACNICMYIGMYVHVYSHHRGALTVKRLGTSLMAQKLKTALMFSSVPWCSPQMFSSVYIGFKTSEWKITHCQGVAEREQDPGLDLWHGDGTKERPPPCVP